MLNAESQRQDIYKWLQDTDPSPLHHQAQKRYEDGTGNWVMRSSEWARWLDTSHRCLWVHGIPGAGKTVLMSHVIERIKQHLGHPHTGKRALVYYYCYYGHQQDETVPFLRWIITQLCRQSDFVPRSVHKMYKYGGEPSLEDLLKAIEDVLSKYHTVYIVVEALDESNPREDLLRILRDLVTDPRFEKIQLLASSRDYIDIEKVMNDFSMSMSMNNSYVEEDIRLHVRSTLNSNSKFRRWPNDLMAEVEDAVSIGARGMYATVTTLFDGIQITETAIGFAGPCARSMLFSD